MSKVAITGNASGTGTFTLAAPDSNSDRTLTLPDNTGTILTNATTAGFPAGSVLQVVNATYATSVSVSSSTFTDTGLTATITPTSATSKILVLVNQNGCRKEAGNNVSRVQLRLMRGATEIVYFEANGGYTGVSEVNSFGSSSTCYLDSPATTSATTYKTQLRNGANASSVSVQTDSETSTITLMEIAA